jgi:hypothetical protein
MAAIEIGRTVTGLKPDSQFAADLSIAGAAVVI